MTSLVMTTSIHIVGQNELFEGSFGFLHLILIIRDSANAVPHLTNCASEFPSFVEIANVNELVVQ